MNKKMIEYWFPIKILGVEGPKEKRVAIGRPPSIHLYFARRPMCACRAIILSSLLEIPSDDKLLKDYINLIENYCMREIPNSVIFEGKMVPITKAIENAFQNQSLIPEEINAFDSFAGGGTFPLEMRYLGLNSYSSDLNPIATLIEKATCQFPQDLKFDLINALDFFFNKVQNELEKKLGHLYKNVTHSENKINFFIWSRQVKCSECNLWIPLIKNFFLSKKYNWALIPTIPQKANGNEIAFSIGWPNKLSGYYKKGKVECPRCKKTISSDYVIKSISEDPKDKIIAIYEDVPDTNSNAQGSFRIPNKQEIKNATLNREEILKEIYISYSDIDLEFQKKIPFWMVQKYGMTSVLKFFNSRQLYLIKTLLDIISNQKNEIKKYTPNSKLFKAILLYLTYGLVKMADYNSNLTQLNAIRNPVIGNTFKRAGLFMHGSYVETNPLKRNTTGGWLRYYNSLKKVLINLISRPKIKLSHINIKQMDAMELEYDDNSMDYCFIDPPYYDNIPYAASTDFFYALERPILGTIFPEFFLTPSTPKDTEIVQDQFRHKNSKNAKIFYEKGMIKSFSEIYRVLKNNGLAVIIFAHKDNDAWETLLQAVIDSKLIITNTWPLMMESTSPLRSKDVVSLDSVILLVCRKTDRKAKVYYDENLRKEIGQEIKSKLDHHWRLGFRGADFFLSALGPAIGEFSQYESVLDIKTDEPIKLRKYIDFIDEILVKFSLSKALGTEKTSTDAQTQLYLVWRASYKLSKLPYDEVWKFTHTLGLDDKKLEGNLLKKVRIKSNTVYQCLDTFSKKELFMNKNYSASSLIDALQYSGFLWSENDTSLDNIMNQFYSKYGDEFWYVAQALINLIPDAPESKLFVGLMRKYGKGLNLKYKITNNNPKIIQKTFSIEGKNITLKENKEENNKL